MKFMELATTGKVDSNLIDEFVAQWHHGDSKETLNEFLGMTKDEYKRWAEKPETLPSIIQARLQ